MDNNYKQLFKYGFHDCAIDCITVLEGKMELVFPSGVYMLNCDGKETDLTKQCKVVLEVEKLKPASIWKYVDIRLISPCGIREMEFEEFVNLIKTDSFQVDMQFYSFFCNTILIRGYVSTDKYEIVISNVQEISIIFAND